MIEVFKHGGGTQSAAITALIVQGKLPRPDFVLIADTGFERQSTWDYLDAVIRPALASVGLEVHRIKNSEWGTKPIHGDVAWSHNGNTFLMPAFMAESGKMSSFCSMKWKVEVCEKYASKMLGFTPGQARNWIGFSLDETRRAIRMMMGDEFQQGRIRMPLIHDVPLRRYQAIAEVEKMGWPTPPRSACFHCPNQTDGEWRSLTAEEFSEACRLEKVAQEKNPDIFFHSLRIPLDQIDFDAPPHHPELDFGGCSSGNCML